MRIAVRIVVCAFMGAALNFVVAARYANHVTGQRATHYLSSVDDPAWPKQLIEPYIGTNSDRFGGGVFRYFGSDLISGQHITVAPNGTSVVTQVAVSDAGVPCRAFRGFTISSNTGPTINGALMTPALRFIGIRSVPYRPIWPGLLINTLVYAAIVWLVWAVAARLRRRARLDRRLCPSCKYDVHPQVPGKGSFVCTECGTTVQRAWYTRPRQFWRWWWLILLAPWFIGLLIVLRLVGRWETWRLVDGDLLLGTVLLALLTGGIVAAVVSSAYPDRGMLLRIVLACMLGAGMAVSVVPIVSMFLRYFYGV